MASRLLSDLVGGSAEEAVDPLELLTEREREVLALLAEGLRNREIGERLFIGESRVNAHVRHVLDELQTRNRAEAAAFQGPLSRLTAWLGRARWVRASGLGRIAAATLNRPRDIRRFTSAGGIISARAISATE